MIFRITDAGLPIFEATLPEPRPINYYQIHRLSRVNVNGTDLPACV
jgi:hypothetical protein